MTKENMGKSSETLFAAIKDASAPPTAHTRKHKPHMYGAIVDASSTHLKGDEIAHFGYAEYPKRRKRKKGEKKREKRNKRRTHARSKTFIFLISLIRTVDQRQGAPAASFGSPSSESAHICPWESGVWSHGPSWATLGAFRAGVWGL
jgi:hypothetical protein